MINAPMTNARHAVAQQGVFGADQTVWMTELRTHSCRGRGQRGLLNANFTEVRVCPAVRCRVEGVSAGW